MRKFTDKQVVRIAISAVAGLLVLIALTLSLVAVTNANRDAGLIEEPGFHQPTTTVATVEQKSLDGQWVTDSNGVKLTATVARNMIKIELRNNDTTINFWDGTFVSFGKVGDVIASIKSQTDDIMVSSAESKTFTIGDGTMTFDLSFMGVTKTVTATHV